MKKETVKETTKSVAAAATSGSENKSRVEREKKDDQKSGTNIFPVVAIGASAGGLEATCQLLKHLGHDLGMAYVFIHHLAPDYDSHLPEILQRESAIPVLKVYDGMKLISDHVYVIPPKTRMSILDGHLALEIPKKERDNNKKSAKPERSGKVLKPEQALKENREQIRVLTEDFDTSREELQSANEEILSSNEEFQSIIDEPETSSKEELQSANEELTHH